MKETEKKTEKETEKKTEKKTEKEQIERTSFMFLWRGMG